MGGRDIEILAGRQNDDGGGGRVTTFGLGAAEEPRLGEGVFPRQTVKLSDMGHPGVEA